MISLCKWIKCSLLCSFISTTLISTICFSQEVTKEKLKEIHTRLDNAIATFDKQLNELEVIKDFGRQFDTAIKIYRKEFIPSLKKQEKLLEKDQSSSKI